MTATTLRTIREARGMSQAQLARISGVHAVMLSRIESGKTKHPRAPTLFALACALNVEPAILLGKGDSKELARIQRRAGAKQTRRSADSARKRGGK